MINQIDFNNVISRFKKKTTAFMVRIAIIILLLKLILYKKTESLIKYHIMGNY
jgi:hypothetical protein